MKKIILDSVNPLSPQEIRDAGKDAVIVDMMGLVNVLTPIPDTYEDLAKSFVSRLPIGYRRVDIVADSYEAVKLYKNGVPGDKAEKILIPSLQSRVHPDFKG